MAYPAISLRNGVSAPAAFRAPELSRQEQCGKRVGHRGLPWGGGHPGCREDCRWTGEATWRGQGEARPGESDRGGAHLALSKGRVTGSPWGVVPITRVSHLSMFLLFYRGDLEDRGHTGTVWEPQDGKRAACLTRGQGSGSWVAGESKQDIGHQAALGPEAQRPYLSLGTMTPWWRRWVEWGCLGNPHTFRLQVCPCPSHLPPRQGPAQQSPRGCPAEAGWAPSTECQTSK